MTVGPEAAKAVEATAKALQPITEVTAELAKAVGLDPVKVVGDLAGDGLRAFRSVSLIGLAGLVEKIGGRPAGEIFARLTPDALLDTLDKGSRTQDGSLQELWARLTVASATADPLADSPLHRSVLAQLSPLDAKLLGDIAAAQRASPGGTDMPFRCDASRLLIASLERMVALRILTPAIYRGASELGYVQAGLSEY